MGEERIVKSISVRSQDEGKKRVCDLGFDKNGHIYIIDVENDRNGKKKYVVCLDAYINELVQIMGERQRAI